ncbi:MAG: hypothetical protein WEA11_00205 [Acidimicrobiales bacterium]
MTVTSESEHPMPVYAVETWSDPVIDLLGHDPRSAYVEKFWLPILGPSSVWLLRRLADGLDRNPNGFDLDLVDTAQSLGVGMSGGRNAPLLRTFERCCRFGAARMAGPSIISVRRRLAPLTRSQTERLPASLRSEHEQWLSHPRVSPTFKQMQTRARSLALSMVQIGEDAISVERQLHRWRFHPAIAHDALRWALAHPALSTATSGVVCASAPGVQPKVMNDDAA